MKKRCLSILLVLALCLAYMPAKAYADVITTVEFTGIPKTVQPGATIARDLSDIDIQGGSSNGIGSDGKYLVIDGTNYYYPWDTSLVWEAGKSYTLYIPLQVGDPDSFSSSAVATVNGRLAKLSNIEEYSATLAWPITVSDGSDTGADNGGDGAADPAADPGADNGGNGAADPTTDPGADNGNQQDTESVPAPANQDGSYDFTAPSSGNGSYRSDDKHWTWGERAQLPAEVAVLYTTLEDEDILTVEDSWELPDKDPDIPGYDVDEALICEDNEPSYYANGSGEIDEYTFGKSDFYIVKVGKGDAKIDFPKLVTGDVVSNTTFNGVYVTKLIKTGNAKYDTDLAQLKSDTIAAFRSFELDHPEIFWLTGSTKLRVLTVTVSGVQTSYIFMTLADDKGFSMLISDYAKAGAIETAVAQRDSAVAAIIAKLPADGTPREKVTQLNKLFTTNNEYNRSADLNSIGFTPHRALKSLVGNEGTNGPVCDGYSRGIKVICDKLGIPCILDTGIATSGSRTELHMWNRIRIDGNWYGLDCTWNDPIVPEKNGKISGYENEKYLLVGNDTIIDGMKFGVSHPANKTAGGTTGVLFADLKTNKAEDEGYVVLPFTDVKLNDWFYDHVKMAYAENIVTGMTTTTYGPGTNLTHAHIMVMVAKLHSAYVKDGHTFTAVPGDHWAAAFRDYCKAEGIIDSRFDENLKKSPEPLVTREEMAYYFANALPASAYKNKKSAVLKDIAGTPYAAEIQRLANANLVSGYADQTFRPKNNLSRAEAAAFVRNLLILMGE